MLLVYIELAKKLGQSAGFGEGLVFLNPIFMAMLSFDKNYVYQGAMLINNGQMYNQQPVQVSNYLKCGSPINPRNKFYMSCGNPL